MAPEADVAFEVVHVDEMSRSHVIASNLSHERAVELARQVAQRRRLGRMFRAGSAYIKNVIVINECSIRS